MSLSLVWQDNILTITGRFYSGKVAILYLEAYCRPGSTHRNWSETVIPHRAALISASPDGNRLELRDTLVSGVIVNHILTASEDEVDFRLEAINPTPYPSEVEWAQPCIRVGAFTGCADHANPDDYLERCFIFMDGRLTRMPTPGWGADALYTPGQVWVPAQVSRADVNPRALNPFAPSNGLIGCFSGDDRFLLATAWDPYQELFQGVYQCLHSDFRIGGLQPGEHKVIRGKLYIMPADVGALLKRYERDFSGQTGLA